MFVQNIRCEPGAQTCTCINLEEIPYEWRCDGHGDCALNEDEKNCAKYWAIETAHDYGLTSSQAAEIQTLWTVPTVVVPGQQNCADRLFFEVKAIGQPSGTACDTLDGNTQCSLECANLFVPWRLDCNSSVPTSISTAANSFFVCCLNALATQSTAACEGVVTTTSTTLDAITTTGTEIAPCAGQGDGNVPLWWLGDGVCQYELQCKKYASDAGDCEQTAEIMYALEVTGAISEQLFRDAFSATIVEVAPEDLLIHSVKQTIHGTFTLKTSPKTVAMQFTTSPQLKEQLAAGMRSLLGLLSSKTAAVEMTDFEDCANAACTAVSRRQLLGLAKAGNHGVKVSYEVTASKNVVGVLFEGHRNFLFSDKVDRAVPQAFPKKFCVPPGSLLIDGSTTCASGLGSALFSSVNPMCGCTSIRLQNPTVQTAFNTSIAISSYDLYKDAPTTRPSSAATIGEELVAKLNSYVDDLVRVRSGALLSADHSTFTL